MSERYRDDYSYGYERGFDDGRNSVLRNLRPYYGDNYRNNDVIYSNEKASKKLSEVARAVIVLFKMLTWLLTTVACAGLVIGLALALLWFNASVHDPSNKVWGWTQYSGIVLVISSIVGLAAALFHLIEFFIVLFNKKGWFKKKNLPVVLGILSVILWFCVSATILYVTFGTFTTIEVPGFNFKIINDNLPYIGFLRDITLSSSPTVYLSVSLVVVVISGIIGICCLKSIDKIIEERE